MAGINIAIDGFSSCGKSTLAKQLAHRLGYTYIDSGAMYRAVALYGLENGMIEEGELNKAKLLRALDDIDIEFLYDDAQQKATTCLNGRDVESRIRNMDVSNYVILVSPIPEVRAKLLEVQQAMAAAGGVVMDGRDIGTAVIPDAEVKFFLTARSDVRVQRRYLELRAKGSPVDLESVRANILKRDKDDTERKANPLRQAPDAIVIDNSDMSREEQLELALRYVHAALNQQKGACSAD